MSCRDPFAAHRQQMRMMFGPFGMDPFALNPAIQPPRAPRRQAGAMTPFGMMGMERMSGSSNCQTYSSSTMISYSSSDAGPPEIRETRQSMRDSESGLERLAIGHHIGERGHVMERSRNRRTGDREDRNDFINLDETDAGAFDEEWRREAGRYVPPTARALEYGRDRRGGGPQLALPAPPAPPSPQTPPGARHESPRHESPRHESPRHRQPQSRPRYDW
ncbi:Myeloid leukemia factor 2 [Dissostichus eleginoides]|uniref:Myeloid leukemia factor 2 n=1 Tax=Dissostichus eleginoides TaxID=100907 RepID=A0AAD9FBL1_DISEL|nr:Myeloid leukemia factor 2 [Dissostichus eleginoides]